MKIKELFTDESKWTRGTFARNEKGEPCSLSRGVSFCIEGAVMKCYPNEDQQDAVLRRITEYLRKQGDDVVFRATWNDFRATFIDVKMMVEELDI